MIYEHISEDSDLVKWKVKQTMVIQCQDCTNDICLLCKSCRSRWLPGLWHRKFADRCCSCQTCNINVLVELVTYCLRISAITYASTKTWCFSEPFILAHEIRALCSIHVHSVKGHGFACLWDSSVIAGVSCRFLPLYCRKCYHNSDYNFIN